MIPCCAVINQLGALFFLSFCIIVIDYSWQRNGPLFIPGLRPGEPLLLAQYYLSGTGLQRPEGTVLMGAAFVRKAAPVLGFIGVLWGGPGLSVIV